MSDRVLALRALVSKRPLHLLIVALLGTASVYLTLQFCLALNVVGEAWWVMVLVGLALELSKYTFSFDRAPLARLLVVVLILFSIAASMGHLLKVDQGRMAAEESVRSKRVALSRSIEGLQEEMAMVRSAAARDIKVGRYRSRGREVLATQVAKYHEQIAALRGQLDQLPPVTLTASAGQIFDTAGAFFRVEGRWLRVGANLLLAILIEALGLLALSRLRTVVTQPVHYQMVTGNEGNERVTKPVDRVLRPVSEGNEILPVPGLSHIREASTEASFPGSLPLQDPGKRTTGRGDTAVEGAWDSRFRRLQELVLGHPPGRSISYGRLREELSASNRVVRRYLEELARQGLVEKQGRSWVRAVESAA